MRNLTQAHLDGIEAQFRLLEGMFLGLRHHIDALKAADVPRVQEAPLPERCQPIDDTRCALRSDDGKVKNLAGTWFCRGCRIESEAAGAA